MSKISDRIFKPILRIKSKPRKSGREYFFKIYSPFIENLDINPENSYYLFVTEEVNRELFGRPANEDSKMDSKPFDEKKFRFVLNIKGQLRKSGNSYYFKIDIDYINAKQIFPEIEYNLFIIESSIAMEGKDNTTDEIGITGFNDRLFTPILRIIAKPRKSGITYIFPVPIAFVENENILPDIFYDIFVTTANSPKKS